MRPMLPATTIPSGFWNPHSLSTAQDSAPLSTTLNYYGHTISTIPTNLNQDLRRLTMTSSVEEERHWLAQRNPGRPLIDPLPPRI